MVTISLCMIVKNEEDTIGRCLTSVADLVDEINIVDTGSTDQTKSIVRTFTDRVYEFKWIDDFAAARNYAFSLATQDYILWLDADDVLKEEDRVKLLNLKKSLDPAVDSVTMHYHLAFDEFGNVTSSVKRNRLVKRSRNFQWIGAVHEYLEVGGHILHSDIAITHSSTRHDSDRNLHIYEKRLAKGEQFSPRDLYYFANELLDHQRYEQAIIYYEKFLATEKGWVEDNISACGKLADCYHQLKIPDKALECTLRSFRYDAPRPDACCRLGFYFLNKNEYQTSIFWYNLALTRNRSDSHLGFYNHACATWLPHLQLCVCYDRIGQYELAYQHNELAGRYRPGDARVLYNKQYLEKILHKDAGAEGKSG